MQCAPSSSYACKGNRAGAVFFGGKVFFHSTQCFHGQYMVFSSNPSSKVPGRFPALIVPSTLDVSCERIKLSSRLFFIRVGGGYAHCSIDIIASSPSSSQTFPRQCQEKQKPLPLPHQCFPRGGAKMRETPCTYETCLFLNVIPFQFVCLQPSATPSPTSSAAWPYATRSS